MRWNPFRKKKKKRKSRKKADSWEQKEPKKSRLAFLKKIRFPKIRGRTKKTKKQYHISRLLSVKRVLAGILLIINVLTSFLVIDNSAFFFFFFNSIILLDYLWKTRKASIWTKIESKEE